MSPMTYFERSRRTVSTGEPTRPPPWSIQPVSTRSSLNPTAVEWGHADSGNKENEPPAPLEAKIVSFPPQTPQTPVLKPATPTTPSPREDYVPPHLRKRSTAFSSPLSVAPRDLSPGKRLSSSSIGDEEDRKRVKFAEEDSFICSPPEYDQVASGDTVEDVAESEHETAFENKAEDAAESEDKVAVDLEQSMEHNTVSNPPDDQDLDTTEDEEHTRIMPVQSKDDSKDDTAATSSVQSLLEELKLANPLVTVLDLVVAQEKARTTLVEQLVKNVQTLTATNEDMVSEIQGLHARISVLESVSLSSPISFDLLKSPPGHGSDKHDDDQKNDHRGDAADSAAAKDTPNVSAPAAPTTLIKQETVGTVSPEDNEWGDVLLTVHMGSDSRVIVKATHEMKIGDVIKAAFEAVNTSPRSCTLSLNGTNLSVNWTVNEADLMDGDELDLEF